MHTFHSSYLFNEPEVTNEYNLLNQFLSTSLMDGEAMYSGDDPSTLYTDSTLVNNSVSRSSGNVAGKKKGAQQATHLLSPPDAWEKTLVRPPSVTPTDQAKETYYMTAADPSGSDAPDVRIEELLQAKYDAGMLRPFNYLKGYARLDRYMAQHMRAANRQKILKQLDRFRPKFRERIQSLTDVELVLVEMWFERSLMEYDRVFASMAIPACCWRRTGEIFRGNKEMAELIHVPIESLRDVRLCLVALATCSKHRVVLTFHHSGKASNTRDHR